MFEASSALTSLMSFERQNCRRCQGTMRILFLILIFHPVRCILTQHLVTVFLMNLKDLIYCRAL